MSYKSYRKRRPERRRRKSSFKKIKNKTSEFLNNKIIAPSSRSYKKAKRKLTPKRSTRIVHITRGKYDDDAQFMGISKTRSVPHLPERQSKEERVKRVCKTLVQRKNPNISDKAVMNSVEKYINTHGYNAVNELFEACEKELDLDPGQLEPMFNLRNLN